jgi:hypothetical protein
MLLPKCVPIYVQEIVTPPPFSHGVPASHWCFTVTSNVSQSARQIPSSANSCTTPLRKIQTPCVIWSSLRSKCFIHLLPIQRLWICKRCSSCQWRICIWSFLPWSSASQFDPDFLRCQVMSSVSPTDRQMVSSRSVGFTCNRVLIITHHHVICSTNDHVWLCLDQRWY